MLISRIISGNDGVSIILAKGSMAKFRNYSFNKRVSGFLQSLNQLFKRHFLYKEYCIDINCLIKRKQGSKKS